MTSHGATEVVHSALAEGSGVPLSEASLTDRQRLGVLLQASSLLCHLKLANRSLVSGWKRARVDARGVLTGLATRQGTSREMPQTQLTSLAVLLFRAERRVAGRGEARRIVRRLLELWEQQLAPLPPDEAVTQIMDAAGFLWSPSVAHIRTSLAAELVRDGEPQLWVAGPEWFRAPLLRQSSDLGELERLVSSSEAEDLWRGRQRDARRLVAQGRWRAAVAAWRSRPREEMAAKIEFATALYAVGRYTEAIDELRRMRREQARVLRARCLMRLGELRRAKREVERLESRDLSGGTLLDAASVAIRLYGNLGLESKARAWAERARRGVSSSPERGRAELLAFAASWDRGDRRAMARHLRAAEPECAIPELRWRWHKAKALESIDRGEGSVAVENLRSALAMGRKHMTPMKAGDAWNEMALARSLAGDLEGAERALLHTLRLHRDAEGPRKTTLALFNLAEVRLRQGKLDGVREILEQSTRENRAAGNWRGMVHDIELWGRYDLVRGRPSAAEERLVRALAEFERRKVTWRQGQLRVLLARALGWLGRAEDAAIELEAGGEAVVADLEPEERPALWALAGDRERALESIDEGPSVAVWRALLTGGEPPLEAWDRAASLGEYRFSRMVFDAESIVPGSVPAHMVSRAAAVLRRTGSGALAEQLDIGEKGPWKQLADYLEQPSSDADAIARLLTAAGYGEARLTIRSSEGERVVVDAPGGRAELVLSLGSENLVVSSSWIDSVLRALALVIAGELRSESFSPVQASASGRFGMVGESKVFLEAMDKLSLLARESVPVLLCGETGTGKELAARRVHRASPRADGPFIPLNCAAVSEELLMSDLFGHVRGAYTGAVRDRVGVFEAARGGTVFLDEIGDLPLRAQGFLLRVLQEGEVRRVGESLARSTDVRVVTATHRDLEEMVRRGEFRADLYYRLRVAMVDIPPLRERGDDLMLLALYFLERLSPHARPVLTARSRAALRAHRWPGNVRELENVLSVAVAMAGKSARLEPQHLDLPYRDAPPAEGYHELVLDFRRQLVSDALAASGGNRAEAARQLGLTRQALSYLVRKLGLNE